MKREEEEARSWLRSRKRRRRWRGRKEERREKVGEATTKGRGRGEMGEVEDGGGFWRTICNATALRVLGKLRMIAAVCTHTQCHVYGTSTPRHREPELE